MRTAVNAGCAAWSVFRCMLAAIHKHTQPRPCSYRAARTLSGEAAPLGAGEPISGFTDGRIRPQGGLFLSALVAEKVVLAPPQQEESWAWVQHASGQ